MPYIGMTSSCGWPLWQGIAVVRKARRSGEEYELLAGVRRCIAMSLVRLDLFDFEGAEATQEEARSYFNSGAVSAGIELLFNPHPSGRHRSRRALVEDVNEEVMKGGGRHGWLWRLRFTELQAEVAAARGDHPEAMALARKALEGSRSKHRAKYEAFVASVILAGRWRRRGGRKMH